MDVTIYDLLWFLLFMSLAVASVPLSHRYLRYWFTPLSMYMGINSLSMAFYHLRLIPMIDVPPGVHLLLLGSILSFNVGVVAAVGRRRIPDTRPPAFPVDMKRLDIFFYWTAMLAITGGLIASLILLRRYGLVGLIADIWTLQEEFQMQYIGYLNVLGVLVLPAYVIKYSIGRARPGDIILVGAVLLGLLLAGIKSYFISSCLTALLVWSVCRPGRFKIHHLAVGAALIIGYFVIYNRLIDVFISDVRDDAVISGMFSFIYRPYLYFIGSWPALGQLMQGTMESLPRAGFVTLQPVWKILEVVGAAATSDANLPFVDIGNDSFNVFAFVGEVYLDWGIPGSLLGSVLLGFISTRLYLRANHCRYWAHVLVYGIVCYGVIISYFAYMYRFNMAIHLLYTFILGFVVLRGGMLVDRRTRV